MGVTVDETLVQRVAALAKLSLTPDEVHYYQDQLQSILKYVDQLSEASFPEGAGAALEGSRESSTPEREDLVRDSINLDSVLNQAPLVKGTSFQVPRIIE
jgi:aspartyl/glutamyl-tRNA(Asn/Gln) amidotransferase C subunit